MVHPYFYVPNIIDYLRAILLFSSYFYAFSEPWIFALIYFTTYALDAIDGLAARMLDQGSTLGAGLDMVLDRSSTSSLLAFNIVAFPKWAPLWVSLISIDLSSHYLAMLSSDGSHKATSVQSHGYLLHIYYNSKPFLTTLCALHEYSWLSLFLLSHLHHKDNPPDALLEAWNSPDPLNYYLALSFLVSLPFTLLKVIISLRQGSHACFVLANRDIEARKHRNLAKKAN